VRRSRSQRPTIHKEKTSKIPIETAPASVPDIRPTYHSAATITSVSTPSARKAPNMSPVTTRGRFCVTPVCRSQTHLAVLFVHQIK
jgi:hypothetical protein